MEIYILQALLSLHTSPCKEHKKPNTYKHQTILIFHIRKVYATKATYLQKASTILEQHNIEEVLTVCTLAYNIYQQSQFYI